MKLTESEIAALARFLNMTEFDFVQEYTRLRDDRLGLVLKEHADGSCIFLKGNDCVVQPAKPQQCREFPNGWNFPGFQTVCRAKPRHVSPLDLARLVGLQDTIEPDQTPVR